MFLAGDEFGNSQYGNNNSYCQDNEISWLDWTLLEKNKPLFEFFQYMIRFRKNHPVIMRNLPKAVCGMEPIRAHAANAEITNLPENARTFAISFAGYDMEKGSDDLVYVAINSYWEPVPITLPKLQNRGTWHMAVNTAGDKKGKYYYREGKEPRVNGKYTMPPRSVVVFIGRTK